MVVSALSIQIEKISMILFLRCNNFSGSKIKFMAFIMIFGSGKQRRKLGFMQSAASHMAAYKVGDRDKRPWGDYVVTGVGQNDKGEEYCEKRITVNPGQVLSLQSHEHRREHWVVEQGVLTVIRDNERLELAAGQDVRLARGSIHCMANLSGQPCTVRELQEGLCREDDIKRYVDAYGRGTERLTSQTAAESIALYKGIVDDIRKLNT
jgi:mannose-6-phosphate isomerase